MSKRKPDQTITHRIELQQKERELIQDYLLLEQFNKLIASLTSMPISTMYAWLNVGEALDIFDTPIPTVADLEDIPAAINAFGKGVKIAREGIDVGGKNVGIFEIFRYALRGQYPDAFTEA